MARVKSAVTGKRRHVKKIKKAKGYFGFKSVGYKTVNETIRHAETYAFRDRKTTKRNFRALWIKRINIAANQFDMSYSQLIHGLNLAKVELNRKMLADIAATDIEQFEKIVNMAKEAIKNKPVVKPTADKEAAPTKTTTVKKAPPTKSAPTKKEVK